MKRGIVFFSVLLIIILLAGCKTKETPPTVTPPQTTPEVTPEPETQPETPAVNPPVQKETVCPASCDDNDACTRDVCSYQTDYECRHAGIYPCCGNSVCEASETQDNCAKDCSFQEIPEFLQLIENTKLVKNYRYGYELPTEVIQVFVRGADAKLSYGDVKTYQGFTYNNVLRYGSNQTAILFCYQACPRTTAKAVTIEDFPMPPTPLDVLKSLKSVRITGRENIDGKASVVLESPLADGNVRKVKVWEFYGMPMVDEVWSSDKTTMISRTRYSAMIVNTVSSDEFTLPVDPVLGPPVVT